MPTNFRATTPGLKNPTPVVAPTAPMNAPSISYASVDGTSYRCVMSDYSVGSQYSAEPSTITLMLAPNDVEITNFPGDPWYMLKDALRKPVNVVLTTEDRKSVRGFSMRGTVTKVGKFLGIAFTGDFGSVRV
jgi:hypothetical protein